MGFFMEKIKGTVRLPSYIYHELYTLGGDKLVAVFCTLKFFNTEIKYRSYTSKNNRKVEGYGLLRNKTNISLSVLEKYVPILLEKRYVTFMDNGDVCVLGNNALKRRDKKKGKKLIPIRIGKNISETALYSYYVRVRSSEDNQKKMIAKKQHRREIINQNTDSVEKENAKKKVLSLFGDSFELTDKVVMSNRYLTSLLNPEIDYTTNYIKRKLVAKELLFSKRQFRILMRMDYTSYERMYGKNPIKNLIYHKGYLTTEISSCVSTDSQELRYVNTFVGRTISKIECTRETHLDFDFVDWISGNCYRNLCNVSYL